MKRINYFFTIGFILSLIIYAGCGGSEPVAQTEAEIQLGKLSKTWKASEGSVQRGSDAENAFDAFQLVISGSLNTDKTNVNGNYTASGADDPNDVFPSGSWSFKDGDLTTMVRSNGVEMKIQTLTDTDLVLKFSLDADGGPVNRTAGAAGDWTFSLKTE